MAVISGRSWGVPKPRVKTPSEPQKVPWEMPEPKEIKVTARYDAIGAARAAVERESDNPGTPRYRFGNPRSEVMEKDRTRLHRVERHRLYGPTLLGIVEVLDWNEGGCMATASVFRKGLERLGGWHWGKSAVERSAHQ